MKKYLYKLILASLIIISTTVVRAANEVYYTNLENIDMTREEYNNLLSIGFTEKQVERMDYETFIKNKDLHGTLVGENTQYYKTTTFMRNGIKYSTSQIMEKDDLLRDMEAEESQQHTDLLRVSGNFYNGISYTTYKQITTRITSVSEDYMRYQVESYWFNMPSTKSYDIMGIGIEPSKVEIGSTLDFRQDYIKTNDEMGYSIACYQKTSSTGGAVMFKLPNYSIRYLEAYMYFYVQKINQSDTIYSLVAAGDYAHATSDVSSDARNHYSINHGTGIFIDSTYYSSYDDIPTADASFLGTW